MNPSPSNDSQHADEQAALWAAKLDGSALTAADRSELDRWLAASPRHRSLLSQFCQFSADLEEQLPTLVLAGAVKLPAETAAPRRRHWRGLWLATTLGAAAAVAVGIWITRPANALQTVATSVAERRTLKLSDGTQVELNARTNLLVDLGRTERHVRMGDGEAFFTVAKDKSRPFIIETPAGSVRVTGTVFDVRTDTPTTLGVTVVEGSVQVTPCDPISGHTSAPVALRANDQLIAAGGQISKRSLNETELEGALAWRHGEVVFDGTPLSDALARFGRYHGLTITASADVAKLRVGGRYSLDNVEAFLTAIEAVLPVRVSHESSDAILVTARTGS